MSRGHLGSGLPKGMAKANHVSFNAAISACEILGTPEEGENSRETQSPLPKANLLTFCFSCFGPFLNHASQKVHL